ncbi:MAG: hypothetical protein ACLUI5_04625 [Fusicatenibacter saccharivorans]
MENNDKKVFLVTEDEEVYKEVVLNLEDKVVTVSFDRYIKNYSAKNFLAKDSCIEQLAEDAHTRGNELFSEDNVAFLSVHAL